MPAVTVQAIGKAMLKATTLAINKATILDTIPDTTLDTRRKRLLQPSENNSYIYNEDNFNYSNNENYYNTENYSNTDIEYNNTGVETGSVGSDDHQYDGQWNQNYDHEYYQDDNDGRNSDDHDNTYYGADDNAGYTEANTTYDQGGAEQYQSTGGEEPGSCDDCGLVAAEMTRVAVLDVADAVMMMITTTGVAV
ncbi:hypothetical protein NM208_g5052 [Fusarium decemcellulare]|uniref:Uncharacterized protein n=1 Tax=Fusarium decemcellulare TaxID=57161 RepID=A0ACC1SIF3_9HYPO|nr:hypothetical protein NM208_g5052 [Fusarium decemcellulare]